MDSVLVTIDIFPQILANSLEMHDFVSNKANFEDNPYSEIPN